MKLEYTHEANGFLLAKINSDFFIDEFGYLRSLNRLASESLVPKRIRTDKSLRLSQTKFDKLMRIVEPISFIDDGLAKELIAKHMPGKHNQADHAGGKGKRYDTSNYDKLTGKTEDEFGDAIAGLGVSDFVAGSAEARFMYRSMPAVPELQGGFVELDKQLKTLTDKSPVSIMMEESVIGDILADGEVKSIFAFDDAMKGAEYLEHRTVYEKIAFNYDADLPVEMRPISGIVFPSEQNNELLDTFGQNYGSVQLVLKDAVKSRTTITVGDSLDTFQRPTIMGGKTPRTYDNVFHAQNAAKQANKGANLFTNKSWWGSSYVEAQVHGGVKLKDIAKVVFHYPDAIDTVFDATNRLDDLGISWEIIE